MAYAVYERGTMAYPTHPPQCDEAGAPALPRRSSIAIVAGNRSCLCTVKGYINACPFSILKILLSTFCNSARWLMVDFACALNDYMDVGVHADWGLDWVAYNQEPGSHTVISVMIPFGLLAWVKAKFCSH